MAVDHPPPNYQAPAPAPEHMATEPFSPNYEVSNFTMQNAQTHAPLVSMNTMPQHYDHLSQTNFADAEQIWRGLEQAAGDLPVWISDQSLGGQSFTQHGIDAFIIPPDYLPVAPQQIW